MNIDAAIADPNLLGAGLGDLTTWSAWRAVLRAAFGLPLDPGQASLFSTVSGGRRPPEKRVRELWAIVGRRSGKSRVAGLVAAYAAAFAPREKLASGETGTVLVLAASKQQANAVFGYARSFFEASPLLGQLVEEVTADEIRLRGRVVLSVHSNSFRTVRGRTLLASVFDEAAFWRDEASTQPDIETYRAALPALATTGGMLVGISSPYAQRGLLYQKHQQSFGKDDPDVLVVQAGTPVFNPTLDVAIIEAAERDDPEAARSEWAGEFRSDLAQFVSVDVVRACIDAQTHERLPDMAKHYLGFVDPSGGSSDSMVLAIAHAEGSRQQRTAILDLILERKPPFSPEMVCEEFAETLKRFRVTKVVGDRYAGEWPREQFSKRGVLYEPADRTRSELYLDLLPLLNSGAVRLLDDKRLVSQLVALERRTARSGKDSIDHGPGAHDDVANAVGGALVRAFTHRAGMTSSGHDLQTVANRAHADLKDGWRRGTQRRPEPASGGYR